MAEHERALNLALIILVFLTCFSKINNSLLVSLHEARMQGYIQNLDFERYEVVCQKTLVYMWLIWFMIQTIGGACMPRLNSARSVIQSRTKLRIRTKWRKIKSNMSNGPQLWTVKTTIQVTIILLLLIAGNINPNPGPIKYPCGTCGKSCRSNQRSIQCDTCDIWTHWKCVSSNIQEYYRLSSSDEEWSCHSCALPNFTDSFFDNEVTIKNSDKNREGDSSLQLSFSEIQDLLPEISESGNLFHKLKENRSQYKKNLTVSYLNINSLRYKFEEIKQILIDF